MSQAPVVIMAAGTGGHVFPGLAVARELLDRGVPVIWLGTEAGLEARLVPAASLPLETLQVRGLRRNGLKGWLQAPVTVIAAVWRAAGILRRHRPRSVLGLGGYVTGPGGVAAWLLRRPLVIHEQNARPGLSNRLLARIARRRLSGFSMRFPGRGQLEVVGNPVRRDFAALAEPAVRYADRSGPLRLLVVGGSLGAQVLNETVPRALAELPSSARPQVRHQSGERTAELARQAYAEAGVSVQLETFIEDMAAAYAWADLVICRAGALTVSELAAAGVASWLVPLPHAVDDHQTANARVLADAGAAVLIPQSDLSAGSLAAALRNANRDQLRGMAERARAQAAPRATERVADICLEVAA
ncbi:undecaprenyldiphospho-muramoylpentapeptide beta-N-acetylglucosaminyltransferase [Methylonatrum kenyense]|uniref:undecaprenyldiphospho-muramoylpentapeptide beta-N-acetylglucosaminyltransferase n=1 Tax=Methylonatrum kenyense TaxID=455253 RepID=UPI0020BF5E8E|nr:undecaprenyldiphospho-muramoylpentapeptide beta-N-acetylglucosaminyltransferase [Methylonatrum kenyense]MCK8516291.1 undecaprenyldiphospho-muramoylpentapeptide beta-N-acetylglucosaminyltransferase [Methylonatrum kenyense]